MSSTALIIRPKDTPDIHVLECDGPPHNAHVYRYPGSFTKFFHSFEEFTALPDHAKFPGPALYEIEHANARRIYRLVEWAEERGGLISLAHLREIRGRLRLLAPFCDQEF